MMMSIADLPMLSNTVSLLALALVALSVERAESQGPDTVVVQSGSLRLHALLWRPAGRGPFPAVLFNHGTWPAKKTPAGPRPDMNIVTQANVLGPVFAKHGYMFLFLFRRGVGLSADQGTHVGDLMETEFASHGQDGRNRIQLQLLETDELQDALAGLAFLRARPEVDARHVAIAGHSFGGSLTLFLAERDSTLLAAIDFSGAAGSWAGSPELRERLLAIVRQTPVPIFFIHTANDYSVAPGKALAAEMTRLGKPHRLEIYPAYGNTPSKGHNFLHLSPGIWERDVFAFLDDRLHR
jgi:carboxymethylenebutenolidase